MAHAKGRQRNYGPHKQNMPTHNHFPLLHCRGKNVIGSVPLTVVSDDWSNSFEVPI
jgi:hypothetical protein